MDASCSRNAGELKLETSGTQPLCPDRVAFQHSIQIINEDIEDITFKLDELVGRDGVPGFLSLLKMRSELRTRRDELKKEADELKPVIIEFKKQLKEKEKQLSDIENDLVYRDINKLTRRLKEHEDAYTQESFTSNRNEKALIKEINKLKRNVVKLSKFNEVVEERKFIYSKSREKNFERSALFKSIRELTNQLQSLDGNIKQCKQEMDELKQLLRDNYAAKKMLVQRYDLERKNYTKLVNSQKNLCTKQVYELDESYPATFPGVKKGESSCVDVVNRDDDELLEPFYEQKMACSRLIEYLVSLQSRRSKCCGPNVNKGAEKCSTKNNGSSDDSAEDFPPSFSALRRHASLCSETEYNHVDDSSVTLAGKKRTHKKSSKKPCQPICYPIEIIRLFKEIEVDVPLNYEQIDEKLEDIHSLLKHYEEQTNVIEWDESDYQHFQTFSESEYTVDSAWNGSTDMSDHGSIYGLARLPSSPELVLNQSPLARNTSNETTLVSQIGRISFNDEGIESRESTR